MSRIPNDITGERSGRPGLVSPGAVSTDPGVGAGAVVRGLEQLGQTGLNIVQAVAQRRRIERDATVIGQAEDAFLQFEQDNTSAPEDSFEQAQFRFDELERDNPDPVTRARIGAIRRRSLRTFAGKQAQATVSSFRKSFETITHEEDVEARVAIIRENGSIDTATKDVLERELHISFSNAVNNQSIAAMSQSDDAESLVEIMNVALEAGEDAGRTKKQTLSTVLVPPMRAAAIEGDVDKVETLGKMTLGLIPDEVAHQKVIARNNAQAQEEANALFEDFTGRGDGSFKIPNNNLAQDKAYRQLSAIASDAQIADYFMRKSGNLPNALITQMKSNVDEGGQENLRSVVETLSAIEDSGPSGVDMAGSVARTIGTKAEVLHEVRQSLDAASMDRAIEVMADPRASGLLDTAEQMFTGRKANKLTGQDRLEGVDIETRLKNADISLPGFNANKLKLTASQKRQAQGLFMFNMVAKSLVRDVATLEDMELMTDAVAKDAFHAMGGVMVDLPDFEGFNTTVLAPSGLLGVGNVTQHVDGNYAKLVELLAVPSDGRHMPQLAASDGETTFIPTVDENGDITRVLGWNPATTQRSVIDNGPEFERAVEIINGNYSADDFNPLSDVIYTPDMGDISFRTANEQSGGRLIRRVNDLTQRAFILATGRAADVEIGSPERATFMRMRNAIILNNLGYPRLSDTEPGGNE